MAVLCVYLTLVNSRHQGFFDEVNHYPEHLNFLFKKKKKNTPGTREGFLYDANFFKMMTQLGDTGRLHSHLSHFRF